MKTSITATAMNVIHISSNIITHPFMSDLDMARLRTIHGIGDSIGRYNLHGIIILGITIHSSAAHTILEFTRDGRGRYIRATDGMEADIHTGAAMGMATETAEALEAEALRVLLE